MELFIARFAFFATGMILFGSSLFVIYAGIGGETRAIGLCDEVRRWTSRLVHWGSLAALPAGLGWLVAVTATMSGASFAATDITSLGVVLQETHFGEVWQAALVLGVLLAVAGWIGRRDGFRPARAAIVVFLSAGYLSCAAAAGHAAMDDDIVGLIHVATHALHLMAGAAWIGGLLPLGLVIHRARRSASNDNIRYAVRCSARFSSVGVAAVAIVTLTGIANLILLTGNLQGVLASDWGRILMIKLALFVVMVVLAGSTG